MSDSLPLDVIGTITHFSGSNSRNSATLLPQAGVILDPKTPDCAIGSFSSGHSTPIWRLTRTQSKCIGSALRTAERGDRKEPFPSPHLQLSEAPSVIQPSFHTSAVLGYTFTPQKQSWLPQLQLSKPFSRRKGSPWLVPALTRPSLATRVSLRFSSHASSFNASSSRIFARSCHRRHKPFHMIPHNSSPCVILVCYSFGGLRFRMVSCATFREPNRGGEHPTRMNVTLSY